jgi:predicted NBD/HSP70 family sugar kinase
LGAVLAEAVAILDPELVLLGGETLQLLGDSFVETMVLEIRKSAMPSKPLPPVKRSSLGADAGARKTFARVFTELAIRQCYSGFDTGLDQHKFNN